VTASEDNVPTLVMLGCAAVANVPLRDVADTFPLTVKLKTLKFPDKSIGP
jgi:hypothetical protein